MFLFYVLVTWFVFDFVVIWPINIPHQH